MTCEARDFVVVALAHYHAMQEVPGGENLGREDYIREIKQRWNHPTGRQLRLLRDRWFTEAPGWSMSTYEMFQHRQQDKLLGALAHLCMARQMAPPWESNNVVRRKGGARRKGAAARQALKNEATEEMLRARTTWG